MRCLKDAFVQSRLVLANLLLSLLVGFLPLVVFAHEVVA